MLLKLADATEIARRTKEVLDQFERNVDQQRFLLSIFLTLSKRVDGRVSDFADFPLPVLSEVAANGVHTISSVRAPGMELCEQAMTTLLKGYVEKERSRHVEAALFGSLLSPSDAFLALQMPASPFWCLLSPSGVL